MDQSDNDKMTPFDRLISSRQLQMLKLMIPYAPSGHQRMLAIYAKFLELEHTIDFFQHLNSDIHTQAFEKETSSPAGILDELRPYLPEQIRNSLDSILSAFNMVEMVSAMKEMAPAEDGHSSAGGLNPMDMMKEMLTPEQQNMFEMYNAMLNETVDSDMKGEQENG